MKLLEAKPIKIGDKEYPLKKSARAYLKFEEMSGHSIDKFDSTMKDSLNFLYSCLWGGGTRVSFDEFLDLIDSEDIMDLVERFILSMAGPVTGKKQKPK